MCSHVPTFFGAIENIRKTYQTLNIVQLRSYYSCPKFWLVLQLKFMEKQSLGMLYFQLHRSSINANVGWSVQTDFKTFGLAGLKMLVNKLHCLSITL